MFITLADHQDFYISMGELEIEYLNADYDYVGKALKEVVLDNHIQTLEL